MSSAVVVLARAYRTEWMIDEEATRPPTPERTYFSAVFSGGFPGNPMIGEELAGGEGGHRAVDVICGGVEVE
jgi:hypothetical protein